VNRVVVGGGVEIAGEASSPNDHYVPDITRLREELSFVPDVPLESAIARTAAWYRARTPTSLPL
jgi:nucleoside-diphosphate-sugar epimerase